MKTKYAAIAALTLLGAFASCQKEYLRPDNAVKVSVSVGALTKTNAIATDDTQRQFNQGDQISVSTNDQEAVLFQCTSTEDQTWTEAVPNKFLLWTQPTLTFSAYYPVTTGTSMTAFTLPADQSSVEKIALADYMTRQQVISRPEGGSDINLQLERKMARVIVRISGFGNQYFDDLKTVSNVRIYSEASGIADGNPTGSSTEIQPYAQGSIDDWTGGWRQNSTFTALVVPGYGDSGARFIQLSDGEGSTLLVKGIPELEAGNSYTFNLVVGKNTIKVQSVTVQDWTTGETLAGGQAQEELAVPVTSITLNKTETSIKVGATETLSVTSVLPEEATDKTYTWKTSDESKATVDQNGKVTAVAAGTVTIYAEANDGSGVKGNCAVTVTPATITVTINQSDWGEWNTPITKDGVTVSAGMIDPNDGNLMEDGTFSTTLGNFTKIVVTAASCDASGTGWSGSSSSMTWAGTPASTVSFSGGIMGMGMTETTIVCTIVPAN